MASNQVNINLNLQDQSKSIKQRTDEVKGLNKELQKSQQYATGTKSGSSAVAASYSAASQNIEYGRARGSMGGTGASGRDFANQAQGLGGLVRLYATYAANVFAVSAAFTALSNALNTTTMVKGLDQLGAASGVAMGGLAKQFAAASEGAISFREAMEATAKATSSGLSKKQFMELGAVAKGASQALGVNMSDAVSRLTRGITKLEPELLDELGIFTKVGKASEEYARSIGKSVDSLTDFEKRQAFANAVLAEGRQKFGEIAQESNPYDKLLASLKNVAQEILSVVNIGIAPVAKFLAENTALIGVAIAATAVKISQQALPALTSWREALQAAAVDAKRRAEEINTSFGEAFVERAQQRAKVPQIQARLAEAEEEFRAAKRQFLELDNIYKAPNDTLRALQKDRLLNERELSNIKSDITKKTNQNTEASLKHAQSLVSVQLAQQKILDLKRQETIANDLVQAQADKRSKFGSQEWQREQIVINERAKAAKLALVSGVGSAVEERGIGAIGGFYKDVAASRDLSNLQKLKTAGIGTFVGLSTAVGIFSRSLMGAFAYIEVAIVAFGLLSMTFSKNGKELDTFKAGMDNLAESTKTANNVAEKFGSILSTESINAKANAFGNLTDGVVQTVNQLRSVDSAASGWDRFIDGFKVIWGGDIRSRFSVGFVDSIAAAIKTAPEGAIKYELENKLGTLLKTKDLGIEGIGQALAEVPTDKLADLARNVGVVLQESDKVLKKAQAVTQDVKETGKAASEAFLSFSNSVFGASPLQAFLIATTKNIVSIKNAFNDSVGAAAEFKNILSGTTKLELLPESAVGQLQALASDYTSVQSDLKSQIYALDKARDRIAEISQRLRQFGLGTAEAASLYAERRRLQDQMPKLQLDVTQTETALKEKAKEAGKIMGNAVSTQLDLVFQQTALKLKQLDISYKQQVMATLPVKTEESIREQTRLAVAAIDVELQLRKSNENLINSIDLLRVQMEVNAANEKVKFAQAETGPGRAALLAEATTAQENASKKLSALKSGNIEELKRYATDDPGVLKAAMNRENSLILDRQAQDKKKLELMKRDNALIELSFSNARELLESEIKIKEESLKSLKLQPGIVGQEEKIAQATEETAKYVAARQRALEMLPGAQQRAQVAIAQQYGVSPQVAASQVAQIRGTEGRTTALGTLKTASDVGSAEQATMLATARKALADFLVQAEIRGLAASELLDGQKQALMIAREQISVQEGSGELTKLESAQRVKQLAYIEAELERTIKLEQIKRQRLQESLEWSNKVLEAGGVETEQLTEQYNLIVAKANTATSAAQRDFQAKLKTADITEKLMDKQTQYENVFKNSFDSMADAMVEFARTGEFSFKSLINTMLAGLLKIELQMQSEALYKIFRPLIGAGFSAVFGPAPGSLDYGPSIPVPNAKGGVYDAGLEMFAKGGMFTNSIVSEPTLFKFAQGTGLMGEAGPEAIMPLKRDSNGNLGVRAGGNTGGNVDVVVNNYGSEKATTKETTDSRGNRKIEVIIGDMVAGQLSKSGSAVQQSMSNTFGTRPVVPRR
jgi:lambda family phage tail tape measure protein